MKTNNIRVASWKYKIQDTISGKYVSCKSDILIRHNNFHLNISTICFQNNIGTEYDTFDEVADAYNYIKNHKNELQIIDGNIEDIDNLKIVKVKKLQPLQHKIIKMDIFQQMFYQDWIESMTDFFNEL